MRGPLRSGEVHGTARRGDAVLVEGFDGEPVLLPDGERAQLERARLVGPALVGLVQLVPANAPADVVADGAGHRAPLHGRVARVAVAAHGEAGRRRGRRPVAVAEDAQVADGEV